MLFIVQNSWTLEPFLQYFFGCVLVYRYTKEGNINELRHNSMYGYENKSNSLVYRYTRTAPLFREHSINNGFVCKVVREISIALFNIGLQYKRVVVDILHPDVAE